MSNFTTMSTFNIIDNANTQLSNAKVSAQTSLLKGTTAFLNAQIAHTLAQACNAINSNNPNIIDMFDMAEANFSSISSLLDDLKSTVSKITNYDINAVVSGTTGNGNNLKPDPGLAFLVQTASDDADAISQGAAGLTELANKLVQAANLSQQDLIAATQGNTSAIESTIASVGSVSTGLTELGQAVSIANPDNAEIQTHVQNANAAVTDANSSIQTAVDFNLASQVSLNNMNPAVIPSTPSTSGKWPLKKIALYGVLGVIGVGGVIQITNLFTKTSK